jgi:ERCC4-type nuclease
MIKIDHRENDHFKSICDIFFDDIEICQLSVGDIESRGIIFEHKTPDDFIKSVYDGRIFTQIEEMKNNYEHYYIVVSGSITDIISTPNTNYDSLVAAITSCFARGCPVIFCDNYENTCDVIKKLSEKLTDNKNRSISVTKSSIKDDQLRLICSIRGISETRGKILLDKFGSPMSVFNGTYEDITEICGIGDKTFDKMMKILNRNTYKD